MVAVVPAQWLWPRDIGVSASSITLSESLDAELANRNLASVVAWPIVTERHGAFRNLQDAAARLGAAKIVAVSVRRTGADDAIAVFLIDPATGQKLRAQQYFVRDASSGWVLGGMAAAIAEDLHQSGRI